MKPNNYHFFAAAVTAMLLIILALMLLGCTNEEPTPTGLKLHCLQDSIVTGQTCYFQASFGDTLNGQTLADVDTTLIIGATGQTPRDINCQISGKWCVLYCFYIDGCYQFIPCRFTVTNNGVCLIDKCTNGVTNAFWID